ncbi:hypothetical protein ACFOKI_13960 [Sphingomonas qilianensis]|uniref:Uncharacterized protein n=1 Tax=Sphingomonas qilianensis TaxID=1736690 RepID=A0ABU9XMW3_9SPHN
MAKAARLEQTDLRRAELETEYLGILTAALETCAAGRWGLFGHRPDKQSIAKFAPLIDELDDLAAAIDKLRDQLDVAPFTLHSDFIAARGVASPSAVGEPKQAKAWLERLAKEAAE